LGQKQFVFSNLNHSLGREQQYVPAWREWRLLERRTSNNAYFNFKDLGFLTGGSTSENKTVMNSWVSSQQAKIGV